MKLVKFTVKSREIEFVCNARSTRHGFAHDCTMFVDGVQWQEATCHYLNRTWERWTYESVCKAAVRKELDGIAHSIERDYKANNGLTRLTSKRRMIVDDIIHKDGDYLFASAILNTLDKQIF